MDPQLQQAAQDGDIPAFYKLIRANPHILTSLDTFQFVQTPLHIAALEGHTRFFIEVMTLMPSLARKLDHEGFSPLQAALTEIERQKKYPHLSDYTEMTIRMVIRIIHVDPELVRVKSRDGVTPLHYAAETDNLWFISEVLANCPSSITDVTTRGETALHVSVRKEKIAASEALMGWLDRGFHQNVINLNHKVLNWQDDEGNTVLHIAVQGMNIKLTQLLSATGSVHINSTNFEHKTALDILEEQDRSKDAYSPIRQILICGGAKNAAALASARRSMQEYLKLEITWFEQMFIYLFSRKSYKSDPVRGGLLAVAALVATATYNAGINPPGGDWSSTAPADLVGTAVMDKSLFYFFQAFNTTAFMASMMQIFLLLPPGSLVPLLQYSLIICYMLSMVIISPTKSG